MLQERELIRRVTTLLILYYMPDHPSLLQEFMWQTLDVPPGFPRIRGFLNYWRRDINATIHTAEISVAGLIKPFELRVNRTIGNA